MLTNNNVQVRQEFDLGFLHEGVIYMTPEQAGLVLQECSYPHQDRHLRPEGQAHASVLAAIMKEDRLWRAKEKIDFAILKGKPILVNGHHRMVAQVNADMTIPWIVAFHPCANEEELFQLYYTFDTNLRLRTTAQILNASDLAERCKITKSTATATWEAIPLVMSRFNFSKDKEQVEIKMLHKKVTEMIRYGDVASDLEAAIKPAPFSVKQKIYNVGAWAVALEITTQRRARALEFWRGVAENDGLRKGDPRHTLVIAYLNKDIMRSGALESAIETATAWNAFYDGRTLGAIRTKDRNFRLAGCKL